MRIRLRDDGREFPATTHHGAPPLHLIELQMQGPKLFPELSFGMRGLERIGRTQAKFAEQWRAWQERVEAGDTDPGPEPDEPDTTILAMGILAFFSMRAAGERVTFEQALLSPIEIVPDPEDEAASEAPDPTTPGHGDPATPETASATSPPSGPSTT